MADSRAEAEKIQDDPGVVSFVARNAKDKEVKVEAS